MSEVKIKDGKIKDGKIEKVVVSKTFRFDWDIWLCRIFKRIFVKED